MCGGEGVDGDDSLRRKDVRRYGIDSDDSLREKILSNCFLFSEKGRSVRNMD